MIRKRNGERGMSLVEVTIILMVLAIVTAVAAPSIADYVDDARGVKGKEDVEAIGTAIARLLRDTGAPFLLEDGDVAIASRHVTNNRVDLAVGSGMEPRVAAGVDNSVATNLQATLTWTDDIAAAAATAATGGVQSLYDHLVSNDATYVLPTALIDTADPSAPNALGKFGRGWRGAYLSGIVGPDPWGYRYACNTAFLGTATDPAATGNGHPARGWSTDVFCLSAGPNSVIETDIESANGGVTFSGSGDPANDDVIYVISGYGR
jgi:type II secretory pathway pseudopilin PulG